MKQELTMWAVIDNVNQQVITLGDSDPCLLISNTRKYARVWYGHVKRHGNKTARVRKVKVTIEEAE